MLFVLAKGGSSFGFGMKIGFLDKISYLTPSMSLKMLYGSLDIGFLSIKSNNPMQ